MVAAVWCGDDEDVGRLCRWSPPGTRWTIGGASISPPCWPAQAARLPQHAQGHASGQARARLEDVRSCWRAAVGPAAAAAAPSRTSSAGRRSVVDDRGSAATVSLRSPPPSCDQDHRAGPRTATGRPDDRASSRGASSPLVSTAHSVISILSSSHTASVVRRRRRTAGGNEPRERSASRTEPLRVVVDLLVLQGRRGAGS